MTRIKRVQNFSLTIGIAIGECSPAGDAKLRKAIYGTTADATTKEIDERVALSLGDGFFGRDRPGTAIRPKLSFAELCLDYGRVDLLREVMAAKRPSMVDGWLVDTAVNSNWISYVGSTMSKGGRSSRSLLASATTPIRHESVEFIELLLEFGLEKFFIAEAIKKGGAEAALITEAMMRRRIREAESRASVAEPAAPPDASAARPRRRSVGV